MTITNRTRFALWQWDKGNRAWLQTAGPDKREEMEFALEQRVNGARRHRMWGSAYCVLPTKQRPHLPPDQLVALDIEGMSLEIIVQEDASGVDPQPAAVGTAPQPQPQNITPPTGDDALNMVRELLVGAARLRDAMPGTAFGSEVGSDFAVELGEAMRHLRNVGRILREQV